MGSVRDFLPASRICKTFFDLDSVPLPISVLSANPGNMPIAVAQLRLLHLAKLIEAKHRMAAGAAEMSVKRHPFLLAICRAHQTIHI
jgi:hypothetical protein